jgi:hypothetical protein
MAELGVVAAVVGLAGAAVAVSKALFDCASTLNDAKDDLTDLANYVVTWEWYWTTLATSSVVLSTVSPRKASRL